MVRAGNTHGTRGAPRLRASGVAIALLVAAVPARAGSVPYAKLVTAQIMFDSLPPVQRDKVRVRVVISHADKADRSAIHLWVIDGGRRMDLPLRQDGMLDFDLRQDWVDRGVLVHTDQPDASLRAAIDIGIRVPGAGPIQDAYLQDAVRQAQAVISAGAHRMAGFFAIFVTPKVKGVQIRLARCCGEQASLTAGVKLRDFAQDSDGKVSLKTEILDEFGGGVFAASAPVSVIDPWVD